VREHRGLSIAIAVVIVAFCVTLAFTLVVATYVTLSVYALVKGIGSGSDAPSGLTILVAIVLLVTLFAALLAGTIVLVGRPMTPRRRRATEVEPLRDEIGI
jgi:hypothetical protein